MKNFMILIICLLVLISSGVAQLNYLNTTSKYLISDTYYIENLVKNGNYKGALEHYDSLETTWNNMSDVWGIFINYSETDEFKEYLVCLKKYLELEDDEGIYINVALIVSKLEGIVYKQELHIESIL